MLIPLSDLDDVNHPGSSNGSVLIQYTAYTAYTCVDTVVSQSLVTHLIWHVESVPWYLQKYKVFAFFHEFHDTDCVTTLAHRQTESREKITSHCAGVVSAYLEIIIYNLFFHG